MFFNVYDDYIGLPYKTILKKSQIILKFMVFLTNSIVDKIKNEI